MSDVIHTGGDMWEGYKKVYGMITARILCLRYLDLQADRKDPEEQEFCRELRGAMLAEPNLADKPVYINAWDDAKRLGEEEQFSYSDLLNRWCAGEIDEAIRACEYGDGPYKLGPAAQALLVHCGPDRLSFVLAVAVLQDEGPFSVENRDWSHGFIIQDNFAGYGIKTRAAVLDEFITCLRETMDKDVVAELSEPSEAGQNFAEWMAVTESSRYKWVEDEIFRLNGRGTMYYTGGEDGVYIRIHKDGMLESGNYEGAIPHIGEATFMSAVERRYPTFNDAYTAAMEAGGKQFLADMFCGADPQPLHKTEKHGAPEEKPSVLKQIRDAQKAPQTPRPPRRAKAPRQHKNSGDIDL